MSLLVLTYNIENVSSFKIKEDTKDVEFMYSQAKSIAALMIIQKLIF
jgi:hypothetical protein